MTNEPTPVTARPEAAREPRTEATVARHLRQFDEEERVLLRTLARQRAAAEAITFDLALQREIVALLLAPLSEPQRAAARAIGRARMQLPGVGGPRWFSEELRIGAVEVTAGFPVGPASNADTKPTTSGLYSALIARSIPVQMIQEHQGREGRPPIRRIVLSPRASEEMARGILAMLRTAGWDCHQEAEQARGGLALRLTGPTGPTNSPDSPGARVDALLWSAGYDRYRHGVPVWGYRWDHLFADPSEGSAYVTVHGPGDGSFADARRRWELTDAMMRTTEAAEGWRTLRPECLGHAFHALTPEY
ncbi:hypothetical protein [Streptomyces sp. NRRL S-350]|uniref:hypothetical protein n=1 Tax=Streptomyces sp. NRRL S-350 TaxID=1463902 RepID=UPI0004C17698|nr:hypothetical protein [Streptomyces sp. NRRL S-350]